MFVARTMLSAVLIVGALGRAGVSPAQEISLKTAPPVVVRTVPEAGSAAVDPGTSEIRVTFSKEMRDGSWSWATFSKESFPEMAGQPSYAADKRTCVLPVKLQPGKTYAVWVNSPLHRNFQDADGQSAVAYLLVFRTRD